MRLSELEAVVESLLFIAGDAVPLASIAQTIELDKATAKAVVLALADKYEKEKHMDNRMYTFGILCFGVYCQHAGGL